MIPRAVYFLDRNAVSMVKELNADPSRTYEGNLPKVELKAKLQKIDAEGNRISPLLSVIEGEKGRLDTMEEKLACLEKESAALAVYFTKARTDADFVAKNLLLVAQAFSDPAIHGQWVEARTNYLNAVFADLVQPLAQDKRPAKQAEMLELAKKHGLPIRDPVLVLSLACLHRGKAALALIKPSVAKPYNVLGDIDALCHRAWIEALLVQMFSSHPTLPKFEIVTGDKGLSGVESQVEFVATILSEDGDVSFAVKYQPGLFGELGPEAAERLLLDLNR